LGVQRKIFISYRRDDAPGDARGLCERLEREFGKTNVFMDVNKLLAGQRFDHVLDEALSQCEVLIAVIGPRWMELLPEQARPGRRDFVREEIAAALKRKIIVIPVLTGREGYMPHLPNPDTLPDDIRDLVMHEKHNIEHENFDRDAAQLTTEIKAVLRNRRRAMPWRAITISGALGSVLIAVLFAYWMDVNPRIWGGQNTPSPSAEEIARKRADEQAKLAGITKCDRLAASPDDLSRPSGVAGVEYAAIDVGAARTACDDAMGRYPEVARFLYQAGRVASLRKDHVRAIELYRAAIAKGSAGAMTNLGAQYEGGDGVAQDYAEARKWYANAAALGSVVAMANLGDLYASGRGVTQDYTEARKWYEKAAASDNPGVMNNLGDLYYYGRGVPQDYSEARKWFEKGAALGDSLALNSLGDLYDNGLGVQRDYSQARKLYEKAVALNNSAAMNNLGTLYVYGRGVNQDYAEARKWYEKAAALGSAVVMNNLGDLYYYGRGVTQNYAEARKWYEKGAALGDSNAMNSLCDLYAGGFDVKQDYVEARKWCEQAAALGNEVAMANLGLFYDNGRGVVQDYAEARKWYEKAAALGNAVAMFNLGALYEYGRGVTKNVKQAREWYQKAADAGYSGASEKLKKLK
jgi:TPR repeat protein